jgi:uncharacterized protein (TIGR02145 family)
MKTINKLLVLLAFVMLSSSSYAQLRVSNFWSTSNTANASAFLDASSNSSYNGTVNLGKGLVFPRTDLSTFTFSPSVAIGTPANYPTRFDGMIVYNTAVSGVALQGATEGELTPGFWYYDNKSATLLGGTWKQLGSGAAAPLTNGNGSVQYNATTQKLEYWNGSEWALVPCNAICNDGGTGTAPATPEAMTISPSSVAQGATFTISVPEVPGATSYTWTLPNGLTGTSTTNTITVTADNVGTYAAGSISVTANNANGSSQPRSNTETVTVAAATPEGAVTINGIHWATRNVDTFRNFVANIYDYGMFYQWNRATAWANSGDVSGWSNTAAAGTTWAPDPCPAGFRVPTNTELTNLHDQVATNSVWVTDAQANTAGVGAAVAGRIFGNGTVIPAAGTFNPATMLFLPATGFRNTTGALGGQGTLGYYWSSTESTSGFAWRFYFSSVSCNMSGGNSANGYSVRCVAE